MEHWFGRMSPVGTEIACDIITALGKARDIPGIFKKGGRGEACYC